MSRRCCSLRDLPAEYDAPALEAAAGRAFENYKETLDDSRHKLLDRYDLVDVGIKVVGVGSVGTRCLLLLLRGRDENDPLFLQVKEAGPSVLEDHLPPSQYDNQGRRVVEGQRLVQARVRHLPRLDRGPRPRPSPLLRAPTPRLEGIGGDRHGGTPDQLGFYAGLCGMTLARGHARSGDAEAIRAYAGKGDTLDRAVTAFAEAYAGAEPRGLQQFRQAIADGRLEAADLV